MDLFIIQNKIVIHILLHISYTHLICQKNGVLYSMCLQSCFFLALHQFETCIYGFLEPESPNFETQPYLPK